ncbi:hypothetical protein AMTRI_Chr12g237030 [Amborella trichopoda]|uniref:F-box domain-containing protein n=1 Tax=Amborella trichopoda TaxID=13333 RepID=W1PRB8_AMBTC|nr:F-box/LRR-repeat protein 2 [Amborella trichopoda]ERN10374.1 hypothetical protein AMTR_s00026p00111580 [Amborella trichopoda]|eukprot:XP_006848793.1 F-box/LRR-repeat protein 2 [Amborella trichopoda]
MAENWEDLPEECWELVFHHLQSSPRQFESVSVVCRRFLSISNRLRVNFTIREPLPSLSGGLSRLLRRFRDLRRIDLSEFVANPDQVLREISRSGGNKLETLGLFGQKRLPLKGLRKLGKTNKNLRSLQCSRLRVLRDDDLAEIGDCFPFLEELDVSNPEGDGVKDEAIRDLASKLPNLREIDVSGNHLICDGALMALVYFCPRLQKISAFDCNFISDECLLDLALCPSVVSLSVSVCWLTSPHFVDSFLLKAQKLQSLDLSNSAFLKEPLIAIKDLKLPLKNLVLSRCRAFAFHGISSLIQNCPVLEHLNLDGLDFLTDETLSVLSENLQGLTFFSLNSCFKLSNSSFCNLLTKCPNLKELHMEKTRLGLGLFTTNPQAKNLHIRTLKLAWNKNLEDDTLQSISAFCHGLETLDISHCWGITEAGVRSIGNHCPKIRVLILNGCSKVKTLGGSSGFDALEVLDANGSGLTDQGLSQVGSRLVCLGLGSSAGFSESGLKRLVEMSHLLREVDLRGCEVGSEMVAWMVLSRPSLRRVYAPSIHVPSQPLRALLFSHGCFVCNG